MRDAASAPGRQLVLLGASNLTRGRSTILGTALAAWPGRLDVLAAIGHGRSYGMTTWFLGRGIPGIVQCGLWRDLEQRPHRPLTAVLTDVGNDLLYDAPVEQIVEWTATCLNRLAARDAQIVVTSLPLFSIERLNRATFTFFRTLFFPRSRLTLPVVAERARALDAELRRLVKVHGARLVEAKEEWYAFDPIHVRLTRWREAWRTVLGAWENPQTPPPLARPNPFRWARLALCTPERSTRFGWPLVRRQPCGRFSGRLELSLF